MLISQIVLVLWKGAQWEQGMKWPQVIIAEFDCHFTRCCSSAANSLIGGNVDSENLFL